MYFTQRRLLRAFGWALLTLSLLTGGYFYQRARFIEQTNALFDPTERAFTGIYLPWPIGQPSLAGRQTSESNARIRVSLGYEDGQGTLSTNGFTLILYPSDESFICRAT